MDDCATSSSRDSESMNHTGQSDPLTICGELIRVSTRYFLSARSDPLLEHVVTTSLGGGVCPLLNDLQDSIKKVCVKESKRGMSRARRARVCFCACARVRAWASNSVG